VLSAAVESSERDDFMHSLVIEVVDVSATKRQNKIAKQNYTT